MKKRKQKVKSFQPFYKRGNTYIFRSPSVLDIYSPFNYESTVRFIDSLKHISRLNMVDVEISFLSCHDMKVAALVLLYAQLETQLKISNARIKLRVGINGRLDRILKVSGFYHLCEHRCSDNKFNKEKRFLPIISGSGALYRDEIVDYIKQVIYNNQLSDDEEYVFSDAIYEAIDNIGLHAYPVEDQEKLWWLKCAVFDEELYLVLYDQGKGIPASFTRGNKFFDEIDWDAPEVLKSLEEHHKSWALKKPLDIKKISETQMSDEISISFAMSDDITRIDDSNEDKHGQGSKSIKKLVSDHQGGLLWIFSSNGLFRFENQNKMPLLRHHKSPILGTIIQWNIGVKKCRD